MSTVRAWLIGFGIFFYFGITTVWLPNKLIVGPLAASGEFVQGVAIVSVWGFFLVLGMWSLRTAQRKGII